MKMRRAWLCLPLLLLAGCGYRLGTVLPSDIRTIAIPTFVNKTMEPGIEMSITNEIISRFQIDGTLRVKELDEADSRLDGEIIEYRREPVRYAGRDFTEVSEYRLYVRVKMMLVDLDTGEPMWEAPRYVTGDTTYIRSGDIQTDEENALASPFEAEQFLTLEEDLARKVVDSVVSGW